jgi:hypothetical protein
MSGPTTNFVGNHMMQGAIDLVQSELVSVSCRITAQAKAIQADTTTPFTRTTSSGSSLPERVQASITVVSPWHTSWPGLHLRVRRPSRFASSHVSASPSLASVPTHDASLSVQP